MILLKFYRNVTELRFFLEKYSAYDNVKFITKTETYPDDNTELLVVIGTDNLSVRWTNGVPVHFYEDAKLRDRAWDRIKAFKKIIWNRAVYHATEATCENLSIDLETSSRMKEFLKLKNKLRMSRTPGK